jgi:hypothetical protein
MTSEPNPYAPPRARVSDGSEVRGLKRRSVLLMIAFVFATFGLYYVLWFFRRRPGLNRLDSPRKLALWPLLLLLASMAIGGVIGIVADTRAPYEVIGRGPAAVVQVFQIAVGILMIVQCFKIKDIIEDHTSPPPGAEMFTQPVRLSGLMTFFFSIFYLQWAINRYVVAAAPQ